MQWLFEQSSIDWIELSKLYRTASLGDKKPDDLKLAFSNSMYKCFVFDDGLLIGAGRALADGVDCSYLGVIAVHPDFQGHGLRKTITEKSSNCRQARGRSSCTQILGRRASTRSLASCACARRWPFLRIKSRQSAAVWSTTPEGHSQPRRVPAVPVSPPVERRRRSSRLAGRFAEDMRGEKR
jgi:hypothetical protein